MEFISLYFSVLVRPCIGLWRLATLHYTTELLPAWLMLLLSHAAAAPPVSAVSGTEYAARPLALAGCNCGSLGQHWPCQATVECLCVYTTSTTSTPPPPPHHLHTTSTTTQRLTPAPLRCLPSPPCSHLVLGFTNTTTRTYERKLFLWWLKYYKYLSIHWWKVLWNL